MVSVESELAALRAREEIAGVMQRYARGVDARDAESLRTCFTDDATADYVGIQECDSPEHIVSWVVGAVSRYDSTHHLNGVPDVVLDGDSASSVMYLQAAHMRPAERGRGILFLGGIYRDELRRTESGWRIARRVFETTWRQQTSEGSAV